MIDLSCNIFWKIIVFFLKNIIFYNEKKHLFLKKDTTIDNNTAKIVGEALKINKTLIEISLNRKKKKKNYF